MALGDFSIPLKPIPVVTANTAPELLTRGEFPKVEFQGFRGIGTTD